MSTRSSRSVSTGTSRGRRSRSNLRSLSADDVLDDQHLDDLGIDASTIDDDSVELDDEPDVDEDSDESHAASDLGDSDVDAVDADLDDVDDFVDDKSDALELVLLDEVRDASVLVPLGRAEVDRGVRNSVSRRGRAGGTQMPQVIAPIGVRRGVGASTIANSLAHVLATDFDVDVCFLDLTGRRTDGVSGSLRELVDGFVAFDDFFSAIADGEVACAGLGDTDDAEWYAFVRSTRFAKTLEQLRKRFGFVVIDLPSMAEGRTVAATRHLDGFLLVARHGKSSVVDLDAALNDLGDVDEVGVILNRHKSRTPRFVRRWLRVR